MDNNNNNKDFRDSYKWIKINLQTVGVWPNENISVFTICRVIIMIILIIICVYLPRCVALYYLRNYLDGAVYNAASNSIYIISILKLTVIFFNRDVFRSMLNEISNDWNESVAAGYYNVVKKYANVSKNISFSSFLMGWTACILGTFTQKYSNIEIDKKNTPDPHLTLDLVWLSYVPYNVHTTKTIFIIHWIVQWYASITGVVYYLAFDCFCVFLILHLVGQLTILQVKLRNINSNNNDHNENSERLLLKLKYIVQRHQELIRFATILDKCLHKILLIQLITSCLNFSVQGYLLLGSSVKGEMSLIQEALTISYALYSLTHLFFLCYAGEVLKQASINVGYAAYESQWYNLKKNEKYIIMFIIQNSMKPLEITTFKFSSLSFHLFLMVLKTSFSYLSVLLAAKDK